MQLVFVMIVCSFFFFFNDTATPEIYTLSLHDALPISQNRKLLDEWMVNWNDLVDFEVYPVRSEEHTSELQSRQYLVCRLLLEKKKKIVSQPLDQTQDGASGVNRAKTYRTNSFTRTN